MKIAYFSIAASLSLACAGSDPSTSGTGGTQSARGGANATGAGGSTSGGVQSNTLGGAATMGGNAQANGGAVTMGGANSGGSLASNSGGMSSGGANSGGVNSGGMSSGGMSSGGKSGGVGGVAGANSGGAMSGGRGGDAGATSGGASGGSTGAAGTGAGGGGNDTSIAGKFDGALITYPCGAAHSGFDCDNVGCSNGKVTHAQTFEIGGESGRVYNVTFRVRGIVEAYTYVGGTRDAGDASISKNPDLFLRGGAPQPAGASGSDYDVYELDVAPAVPNSPNVYFLNSVTSSENPHTSSATLHLSFAIDYTKTIQVPGRGSITVKQFDSNCKSVMNCGPVAGNSCAAPRSISLAGSMPAPASFTQPYQMPAGAYPQWLFFDVTSITIAP